MPNDIVIIPGSKVITFQDGSNTVQRLSITGSGLKFTGAITSSKLSVTNNLIIDGNLGIGTTAPSAKLHVSASVSTNAGIFQGVVGIGLTPSSAIPRLQVYGTSTTNAESRLAIYTSNTGTAYNNGLQLGVNSDSSAYLYNYSNTALTFATNGTERMRIDATGGISMGTTSQLNSCRLSIADSAVKTTAANCLTFGTATGGANDFQLIISRGSTTNGYYAFQAVEQGIAYKNIIFNQEGGNVGIGTTSPTAGYKLDIAGNLLINANNDSYTGGLGFDRNYPVHGSIWVDNDGGTLFSYMGYYGHKWDTNGGEKMRILGNGNVGIGTTTPSRTLHIYGNTELITLEAGYSSTSPLIIGAQYTGGTNCKGQIWFLNPDNQYGGGVAFATQTNSSGASATERMRIGSDGNVGIGTTTANSRLHVSGSIRAAGGSDSTFMSIVSSGTDRYFLDCYGTSNRQIFALYENSSNAYLNSWSSMIFRVNQTGGSGGHIVFSGGNVGIGTTSPANKLHIVSDDSTVLRLKGGTDNNEGSAFYIEKASGGNNTLTAYGDTSSITGGTPDQSVSIWTAGGIPLLFQVAGAEKMRIAADGNVGIGTSTVSQNKLLVYNSSAATDYTGITFSGGTGLFDNKGGISIYNPNSTTNNFSSIDFYIDQTNYSNVGAARILCRNGARSTGGTYDTDLIFITHNQGGTWNQTIINKDGNVGIGTTSPAAKLHVTASNNVTALEIQGNFECTGSIFVRGVLGQNNSTNFASAKKLTFNNDYNDVARGPNKIVLYNDGGAWLSGFGIASDQTMYYTGGNHIWYKSTSQTAFSEFMRLDTNGNLGVGTSSPVRKLDVNGSFRATGLTSSVAIATQMDKDVPTVDSQGTFRRRTYITASAKTTNFLLTNTEEGYYLRSTSATNISCSIRTNATHPIPTNAVYTIFQVGAGTVTVTGSGVVINGSRTTAGQYKSIQIIKVGTNTYDIIGGA